MAQFAAANFTGTAFATLQSADANWSKQTGWTGDIIIGAGGGYVIRNDNVTPGVYRHAGVPASADYTVSADIAVLVANNAAPMAGVCGRMQAAAQTLYQAIWGESAGNIRLFKVVAGTQTQLGSSYAYTLTTTPANLRLRMDGASISVELDGATIIGPVTDSAITTAGAAGIYLFHNRETGVSDATSLDNFSADDIGAASSLTGAVTLDAVTAAGTLADAGSSSLTGSVTLADVLAAGTLGTAPGVLTTAPFRSPVTGLVLAGVTVPRVALLRVSDMAQVATLADQVTSGAGVLTITHAAVVPGVAYLVVCCNADGTAVGAEVYTAT